MFIAFLPSCVSHTLNDLHCPSMAVIQQSRLGHVDDAIYCYHGRVSNYNVGHALNAVRPTRRLSIYMLDIPASLVPQVWLSNSAFLTVLNMASRYGSSLKLRGALHRFLYIPENTWQQANKTPLDLL